MKTDSKGNEVYFGYTLVKPQSKGDCWTVFSPNMVLQTTGKKVSELLYTRTEARAFVKKILDGDKTPAKPKHLRLVKGEGPLVEITDEKTGAKVMAEDTESAFPDSWLNVPGETDAETDTNSILDRALNTVVGDGTIRKPNKDVWASEPHDYDHDERDYDPRTTQEQTEKRNARKARKAEKKAKRNGRPIRHVHGRVLK